MTPLNAATLGVVTPTGTSTSGTLPGTVDVMPGLVVGATASGTYTIDSTTGRGTGTAIFTGGTTPINVVFWVRGSLHQTIAVLDMQTANADLFGLRLQ